MKSHHFAAAGTGGTPVLRCAGSIQQRVSEDVHIDLLVIGNLISSTATAARGMCSVVQAVHAIQHAQPLADADALQRTRALCRPLSSVTSWII